MDGCSQCELEVLLSCGESLCQFRVCRKVVVDPVSQGMGYMRDAAVDVLLAVFLPDNIENEIDMPVLHGQPGAALLPDVDEPVEKSEKVLVQRRILAVQGGAA